MLVFNSVLVDVQTSSEFNSLIFSAKRYDSRLKKTVEYAESVGISKECLDFIPNYRKYIGEVLAVGVTALQTKKGGIFLLTTTDVLNESFMISE